MSRQYDIAWTPTSRRVLTRLPEKVAAAAIEFIYGALAENPHRVGKALRYELEGLHSARRGDYRIIYRITDVVTIVTIEHRADAFPIDLLKTEQDRIRASLQAITGRLDTLEITCATAEPAERRMFNRALFDRITINDGDDAALQPTEAIRTILATSSRPHKERTLPRR